MRWWRRELGQQHNNYDEPLVERVTDASTFTHSRRLYPRPQLLGTGSPRSLELSRMHSKCQGRNTVAATPRLIDWPVPSRLLCRDSSGADENSRDNHAEEESTDMSEERDAASSRIRVNQRVIALDELVQKPAAEV